MEDKKELTYEIVMQMIAETNKSLAETGKYIKELGERLDKTSQSSMDKIDKLGERIDKTNQSITGISKSNGAMAEEIIYNSLKKDKTFGGIKFDEIDRNLNLKLKKFNIEGEFDVVLQNGDTLAIIETKYKVRVEDVSKLKDSQVPNFRKLFPIFDNHKIILGIGGMSFEKKSEEEAKNNGIGIIKIVGDKIEYYTENIKQY